MVNVVASGTKVPPHVDKATSVPPITPTTRNVCPPLLLLPRRRQPQLPEQPPLVQPRPPHAAVQPMLQFHHATTELPHTVKLTVAEVASIPQSPSLRQHRVLPLPPQAQRSQAQP
ncbi:hypothetical protein HDV00_002091 [Rhizophlyctis rosea]|nr:hypothetical protein HDV00_002091 [Rhizophlyctis rosea]